MDFDLFYFLEKNTFQGFILFVQLLLLLLFAWFTGDRERERESHDYISYGDGQSIKGNGYRSAFTVWDKALQSTEWNFLQKWVKF